MAPKHEKGNTTGDHDAADARVRRARALYASISSIMVTGRVSTMCSLRASSLMRRGATVGAATAMPAPAARPYNN